jgi:hypothetical protein
MNPNSQSNSKIKMTLKTMFPRTFWTVVERDGIPELVIWRQWLGHAYSIVSLGGQWGRWDRQRIKFYSTLPRTDTWTRTKS